MTPAIAELQQRPQWVCWKWIERDGKLTKLPLHGGTGEAASSTDPTTWSSYEVAERGAQRLGEQGGVGIVFTDADPYVGIDIDDCLDEGGTLADEAQAIVKRLNSYTEVTPSGRGIRVYVRGALPPTGRRRGKVEMYSTGRYFTITRKHLPGTPVTIEERSAELLALHEELFPPRETTAPPRVTAPLDLSDAELIEKARQATNGDKFARLWAGDTSDYGGDDSAADLALCDLLRFWTGDRSRTDRLFRQSGLMREKWDSRRGDRTYGEQTLDRAFESGEVYDPRKAPAVRVPGNRDFEDFEDFEAETVTGDWTPPVPFRDFGLPPLPTDALPAGLRRYVEAEAVATQVPVELVAALAIPAVALTLAKKVEVRPKPGWWEPVNVWFLCVTKPGSRSSQVRRSVAAPISDYERAIREEAAPGIAMEAASHEVKKRRLARAMDQAAKCDDDMEHQQHVGIAKDLARELEQTRVPVLPRLLVDDVTPEKLTSMMAEQGGKMGLLSSEGGIFGMMAGRYSKNGEPNVEIYLKGHAGDDHTVDRGSRGSEHISKPALTLGVRIQPSVLGELARKPGFRGVGLLGRWAYLLPKDTLGGRAINPPPVPEDVSMGYAETLRRLLAIPDAPMENGVALARELKFSDAARRTLDEFQMWLEPQLGEWGELGELTDWAGKLAGLVVRLSGILHVWRYAEAHSSTPGESLKPWEAEVTAETVAAAIRIGKCLIPHARAAFVQMGADPAIGDARHILGWVLKQAQSKFTERDLWQSMRRSGRFQRKEEMKPALRLLIDHGYIRPEVVEGAQAAGRPSVSFEVNPLPQNPQNPQNPHLQARGEEAFSGEGVTEWEEGEV